MSECDCEAVLLGREPVQGTANADSLASLIRLLSRRGAAGRKYRLRCSRDGLEIRPARRQDDEGFESDDDAVSHTSSDSNSSNYCFVEDHVLKSPLPEPSGASSVATDSANSSGASDNDDADNSLTPQPPTTPTSQAPKPKKTAVDECLSREFYAFNDVAFCHTDAAFPKVLVLVIKKKSKLKKDDSNPTTGLEAVIFQCKSVENLREVCASYKEFSRRLKMDLHFRYPHRRKDSPTDNATSTLYRNVFNDLQKSMSNTSATPNSPFFKTWITHVSGKPHHSFGKESDFQTSESNKYNLVQRTDDDGVTHIEVSKTIDGDFVNSITTDDYSGSSSIISISTPDEGNLFLSSTAVLSQNPYPSLNEPSADSSEIEGVICADIDSSPVVDVKPFKNGGVSTSVDDKKPSVDLESSQPDNPPQRPQRGKYVKKNTTKQKEPQQNQTKSKAPSGKDRPAPKTPDTAKQPGTHERVVRGQFIRVNVEQQAPQSSGARTGSRLFGGDSKPSGQLLSYPVWSLPATQELKKRAHRSREDESDYRSGQRSKSYQRRSRSSGPRASSPPPAARPSPVAYRYIESPPPKPLSNRFFGKLKEIASINNAYVNTLSRRRNSSGDLATAQFYQYLEPSPVSKSSSNLKSVIKKKNCNENLEPKKVTFSAYATVQVVD